MNPLESSFRDEAGFLVTKGDQLYRVITQAGQEDFDLFIQSGLYEKLARQGKIVAHEETTDIPLQSSYYKVIKPQRIPFISYPYEWSFSQLKEAALLTLDLQKQALDHDLSLKDASFFNVQFMGSKPIFIDTLSFERRQDLPWVAYRQFCQHFLGPLLLMVYRTSDFNRHLISYLDGFPLPMISKLLPRRAKVHVAVMMHIVLHAGSQKKYEDKRESKAGHQKALQSFGLKKQLALIDNLHSFIEKLSLPSAQTEWSDYVEVNNNYTPEALLFKKEFVEKALDSGKIKTLWDLGGNTGEFSRLATGRQIHTMCFDGDILCVEQNYQISKKKGDDFMLPLIMDLSNPTPPIGWAHRERFSLLERGPADLVMALALIHHLRISANIPLVKIANFLSQCGKNLIIEFVPKEDSMVERLLRLRKDIFHDYDQATFEAVFSKKYKLSLKKEVPGSKRTLYYFEAL